jgi:hypothetical protein
MPRDGLTKCPEQCDPLLAQSRQVTADAAEHSHPIFGAEASGDLLLDFDHAQISLRLVVVKWDGKIEQEAQHSPFALREPIQQIARSKILLFAIQNITYCYLFVKPLTCAI